MREIRSGERVSWGKVTKRSEKSFSKYKDSIAPKKSESPSEEKKIFKKPEFKEREMGNSEREPSKKSWKKPESKKRSPPKNPKPFVPSPPRRIQKSSDQ